MKNKLTVQGSNTRRAKLTNMEIKIKLILVHRSVVEIIYLLLGRNISFPTYL